MKSYAVLTSCLEYLMYDTYISEPFLVIKH